MSRAPTVFVAGGPRCGSTALFRALAAHPDVFGPARKEPYFYGRDLLPPHVLARPGREAEYRAHYAGWAAERLALDGTPWLLASETAAAEIAADVPDARVVAIVRDPVEMLHSLYALMLVTQVPMPAGVVGTDGRPALSFEEALATADDRRAAARRALAEGAFVGDKVHVFHPDVARFTAQIRRHLDALGPERVHVATFDRFVADPAAETRRALAFLGLDPDFTPPPPPRNASRRVRSPALHRALRRGTALGPLGGLVKRVVPRPVRRAVVERLIRANLATEARPLLAPATAARLRADFRDEVAALGDLLGEDLLTRWGYRDA